MSEELNSEINDSVQDGLPSGVINANDLPSEADVINELSDTSVEEEVVDNISVDDTAEEAEEEIEEEIEEEVVEEHTSVEKEPVAKEPSGQTRNQRVNFKELREKQRALEERTLEAERRAADLEKKFNTQEEQQVAKLSKDEQLTYYKEKDRLSSIDKQKASNKRRSNEMELNLAKEIPDLYDVVTSENLIKLAAQNTYFKDMIDEPAKTQGELYNRGISAYMLIKKSDFYKDKLVQDSSGAGKSYQKQKDLIKKNLNTPQPSNAVPVASSSDSLSELAELKGKNPRERAAYYNKLSLRRSQGW